MEITFTGNNEAERAINILKHTDKSLFLTGKAGTGKSTLLQHLKSSIGKKNIVLAPTGIASLNIGGQTIHSFFGFSFRPYLPSDKDLPNLYNKIDLLKQLDLIIIDEISMVRADIMNAIDLTLRKNLNNDLPFGGKQLLLVGDLLQLPPIVEANAALIIRSNYFTEYFFSAKVFEQFDIEVIELQKIYRQTQVDFIKILNNVRINQINDADLLMINAVNHINQSEEETITLTTTIKDANDKNYQQLNKINKSEFIFKAGLTGTFTTGESTKKMPTDIELILKEGAQILFVKNDPEKKWVNGTIGKIISIEKDKIDVEANKQEFTVHFATWEDIEYKWDKEEGKIIEYVVGTFTQYPIKLAWAITIHKSQGQTFDKVNIDLGNGAFANGQTYVALSRCKTLKGITLTKEITRRDIKVCQDAVNYLKSKGIESLQKRDTLEIELIETIQKLEIDINDKNLILENAVKRSDIIEAEISNVTDKFKEFELEIQKLRMDNEHMKKEITRLNSITWLQKFFGAK